MLRTVNVVPSSVGSQPQLYPQSSTLDVHATSSKGPPLQPVPFGKSMLNLIQKTDWESIWVVLMMCVSQPSLPGHAVFVRRDLPEQRKMASHRPVTYISMSNRGMHFYTHDIECHLCTHRRTTLPGFLEGDDWCWERNLSKVAQLVQIIRFQMWWNTKFPKWRISQDHIQIT